jgi:membrane protease subunit (stomatin/prohibitin family)
MATIDRVKFDSSSDETLVAKFASEELRLGSQLIVNQSQEAVFVKGGEACDVFPPGTHTLSTGNLPLLSKVVDLPFGRQTPFTAEVWFVSKTVKRDLRWGTKAPIPLIDPRYNYPISVRAFGRWGVRVSDSSLFVREIVGTLRIADSAKVLEYFTGEIHQRFSNILAGFFASEKVSIFDANTRLNDLSSTSATAIRPELEKVGIELVNFNVERVSIPDEDLAMMQKVLGRRMEIDQISKATVGPAYTTMRTFDTLEAAASTPGGATGAMLAGGLGLGMGVGAGVPLGKQAGEAMDARPQSPATASGDPVARLQSLRRMLNGGLITNGEYEAKKKEILNGL